jgi:hypothetical protein
MCHHIFSHVYIFIVLKMRLSLPMINKIRIDKKKLNRALARHNFAPAQTSPAFGRKCARLRRVHVRLRRNLFLGSYALPGNMPAARRELPRVRVDK